MEYFSPQGVLLARVYSTTTSPLWLKLRGLAAWQGTPCWAVCRLACHRLFPWLWVTFAMVPDAASPVSDRRPWINTPATGPVVRLGCPSASDPCSVVFCALSLCRPRCGRVCDVPGTLALVKRCAHPVRSVRSVCGDLALVHWCARCVRHVRGVLRHPWGQPGPSSSPLFLCSCLFVASLFFFVQNKGKGERTREHYSHRYGQIKQWCSSAVFLCVVCVACVSPGAAPQGRGARVIVYTGAAQCGSGYVSFSV